MVIIYFEDTGQISYCIDSNKLPKIKDSDKKAIIVDGKINISKYYIDTETTELNKKEKISLKYSAEKSLIQIKTTDKLEEIKLKVKQKNKLIEEYIIDTTNNITELPLENLSKNKTEIYCNSTRYRSDRLVLNQEDDKDKVEKIEI